jgi:putative two-component system response regulator
MKASGCYADIPVIFLTAKNGEHSELEGLSLGAIDYLYKPFSASLLLRRIENHLLIQDQKHELKILNDDLENAVQKKTNQVLELQNAILSTVADLVEFRDDVTGSHVIRTRKYLECLVDEVMKERIYYSRLGSWNINYFLQSAQLHDVGKIAITDLILNKPGKLSEAEYGIMKTHVTEGITIISRIEDNAGESRFLNHAFNVVRGHHEKWDGTGYPAGLCGEEIPLEGRLMAIADVYDALVSVRPYKSALSTDEARAIILKGRGTHFDPMLVDAFERISDKFELVLQDDSEIREAAELMVV